MLRSQAGSSFAHLIREAQPLPFHSHFARATGTRNRLNGRLEMVQRTLSESRGWDSAVDAYERRVKADELSETQRRSDAGQPDFRGRSEQEEVIALRKRVTRDQHAMFGKCTQGHFALDEPRPYATASATATRAGSRPAARAAAAGCKRSRTSGRSRPRSATCPCP